MERRLAAILAADVVGYSHLIREDEAGTLAALKAAQRAPDRPRNAAAQRPNQFRFLTLPRPELGVEQTSISGGCMSPCSHNRKFRASSERVICEPRERIDLVDPVFLIQAPFLQNLSVFRCLLKTTNNIPQFFYNFIRRL